jgi:recombination protein RecT
MTNITDLRKGKKKSTMKEIQALPPKARIKTLLQENKTEIAAALPRHVSIDRMLTIAQTAATSMPQLLECYTPSLFGALIKCTQLGLEPNNALGQAYLIPFRNKKQNRTDCQLMIGYRGMIDLARRSGHVVSIMAQEVREFDEFEWEYGLDEKLRHVPASGDRGEITHFYAYAKLKDGGYQFEVKSKADIDTLMRSTQSRGDYGPWKDAYTEMGRKSLVRALFKMLPVSIELAEAAAIDSSSEKEGGQHLEDVLTGEYTVVETMEDAPAASSEQVQDSNPVDSNGEVFDFDLHASADGEPIYNKDGSFRKKPGPKPVEAVAEEEEEEGDNPDDWELE